MQCSANCCFLLLRKFTLFILLNRVSPPMLNIYWTISTFDDDTWLRRPWTIWISPITMWMSSLVKLKSALKCIWMCSWRRVLWLIMQRSTSEQTNRVLWVPSSWRQVLFIWPTHSVVISIMDSYESLTVRASAIGLKMPCWSTCQMIFLDSMSSIVDIQIFLVIMTSPSVWYRWAISLKSSMIFY